MHRKYQIVGDDRLIQITNCDNLITRPHKPDSIGKYKQLLQNKVLCIGQKMFFFKVSDVYHCIEIRLGGRLIIFSQFVICNKRSTPYYFAFSKDYDPTLIQVMTAGSLDLLHSDR